MKLSKDKLLTELKNRNMKISDLTDDIKNYKVETAIKIARKLKIAPIKILETEQRLWYGNYKNGGELKIQGVEQGGKETHDKSSTENNKPP